MNNKKKVSVIISVFAIALFAMSIAMVQAQYETQQTSDFTSTSSETPVQVEQADTGVSASIALDAGASGTLTTAVATGNPQPQATPPADQSFGLYVTVDIAVDNASAFHGANITISYTDADVQGMTEPYKLYKYNPDTGAYEEFPATFDTAAKTVTFFMATPVDPLFAVSGTTEQAPQEGIPVWQWALIAVVIIAVIIAAFLLLRR